MMHASAANRTLAQRRIVDALHERMQPGLLHQQQGSAGDHGAGEGDLAGAGERARGQDRDGGDLGCAVDVNAARGRVRGYHQRRCCGQQHDGQRQQAVDGEPSRQAGAPAKHRKRADPSEAGLRPARVT
jgi:hypothetical protein